MFNFFKRKKDKKKRGGRKERGQEVGGTAQRGDGQSAVPVSVVSGGSGPEHHESGCLVPGDMGNDISKPISTLQGLPDIPFIEIDRAPVTSVNKSPNKENVSTVTPEPKTEKTEEMKTNMNELSQLQSPYLVKKVSELENTEKPVVAKFENSAESGSECEKYVTCDEASPANETVEVESVTGDGDASLARKGSVASCEEYSSGEGVPVGTGIEGEMFRIAQGGALSCGEEYVAIKSSSEGDLYALKKGCELLKSGETCESAESSEGELSESEQSESDNIIKNDSGCWDQRESSLNLNENESQASQVTSLTSDSGIIDKSKEKKRVKWADIDGQRKLTYEREGSICSSEESSEEESDEEESEKEKDDDEEDDSEEEEDEDESEDEEENSNLTKVKIIDKTLKDNHTEPDSESSSEEESDEDEHEGITSFNEVIVEPEVEKSETQDNEEDSEEASEEESSAEESGNEDELNDDKNPLKIDIAEMQNRIADLQRDISLKASNIDRLQVELDAACNESEMVRRRFKRLEADLDLYKETNRELTERINVSATQVVEKEVKSSKQLEEAERRIKELETELAKVKSEISSLQNSYKKLEADRDMEVQIIQKALEKALTDQEEMEAKYEKEFENLRTLNSSREVQMLEDFEWKLREVQKTCKKKMQDLETSNDKKSSELAEKLAAAQADLEQISHLKLCEIELNQLKQTSSEQRKNLRLTNRKLEELQVSEKILQEEVHSLRASLDKEKNHVATLQALHREELIEKDRRAKLKLEVQINQLTTEWEERLRRENLKVKTETERNLRDEKNSAVELIKKLKDQEISQLKQTWEKKSQDLKKEIDNYKKKISEMEDLKKIDFDNIQTNADREIFDLRRKMDKLDMSYQEKIEKIQEEHEKEMATLKEECDRRVQQSEANLQLQVGNSRTTIELVKQQLQNETQLKLENLEREYQNKLQQQWERLTQEKEEALEKMEQSQKQSLELLYMEIEKMKKQSKTELEGKKKNQPSNQSPRMSSSQKRNSSSNDVSHSRNAISTRLDVAEVAEEIRTQGKEEVLQKSIEQLTKQLNAGKMEIEKLRQQLESRENARQQRNPPQPPPNPRRNRKPRSGRN